MPECRAPGCARECATSRSPPVERGRGPPETSAKDAKRRVALDRAARSPRRYWRGGVAPGSAVPEFAGGGVVELSAGGGVAVVSLGGVAVESLGGGALCSAGGSESVAGAVPEDCCLEQAETSRSAATLKNKALRFIGSPHCLGCAAPAHYRDQLGPNARIAQAFRRRHPG
jgi:hypothetical protein